MLVGIFVAQIAKLNFLQACVFSSLLVLAIFGTALITLKILIPKFLINRQGKLNLLLYLFCSLVVMGVIANCLEFAERAIVNVLDIDSIDDADVGRLRFFLTSLFSFFLCNVAFFRNKMQEEAMNSEILLNEKKTLEMKVLKSQINTHFLHNALNNIYSMIYFGDKENAAKYVMKLSQMLRYVLDECEANSVSLSKEVEYIENYIDFQKARFETDKNVVFKYVQKDNGDIQIPPMIFQPLIENCFKYCPLDKEDSYVNIELETKNGQIRFACENTQNEIEQLPEKKSTGIGLKNLEKRLQIYCKGNYSLNISDKQDFFKVELIINNCKI